jgi:Double zinc ribbon/Adenylate and Guanylate cyclase catalytic domain
MDCPSCGSANPEGKKFCGECGAPLPLRCGACGAGNPHGNKFCGECGAKLASGASTASGQAACLSPVLSISAAERRQLTVMFCDLVGSTALASRLDPEDLREVIVAYHRCVAETVARFEGFIAKYMGDGVLVYFGYPRAHEDDAERAVQAGLELVTAVRALKPRIDAELHSRITPTGLHQHSPALKQLTARLIGRANLVTHSADAMGAPIAPPSARPSPRIGWRCGS